jgi:hypothetical protein
VVGARGAMMSAPADVVGVHAAVVLWVNPILAPLSG